MGIKIECECGNSSKAQVDGRDALDLGRGEKEYNTHDFEGFEFSFNDYNGTFVVTCKKCRKIINIKKLNGNSRHYW